MYREKFYVWESKSFKEDNSFDLIILFLLLIKILLPSKIYFSEVVKKVTHSLFKEFLLLQNTQQTQRLLYYYFYLFFNYFFY